MPLLQYAGKYQNAGYHDLILEDKDGKLGQIVRTGISVLYCRWTTYLGIPLLPRYVTFWMRVRETWSRISAWCVRGGRVFRCGICRGDEGRNNMIHKGRVKSLPTDYSTIRAVWSDSESNFKAV